MSQAPAAAASLVTAPIPLASLADTEALAGRIARALRGGDVLTLGGELGAGKTTLVQAMGRHWHVDDGLIRSPTFSLVNVVDLGEFDLVHADLYRLTGPEDVISSGLIELLGATDCVCVVEWPDAAQGLLPPNTLGLTLRLNGATGMRSAVPNAELAARLT